MNYLIPILLLSFLTSTYVNAESNCINFKTTIASGKVIEGASIIENMTKKEFGNKQKNSILLKKKYEADLKTSESTIASYENALKEIIGFHENDEKDNYMKALHYDRQMISLEYFLDGLLKGLQNKYVTYAKMNRNNKKLQQHYFSQYLNDSTKATNYILNRRLPIIQRYINYYKSRCYSGKHNHYSSACRKAKTLQKRQSFLKDSLKSILQKNKQQTITKFEISQELAILDYKSISTPPSTEEMGITPKNNYFKSIQKNLMALAQKINNYSGWEYRKAKIPKLTKINIDDIFDNQTNLIHQYAYIINNIVDHNQKELKRKLSQLTKLKHNNIEYQKAYNSITALMTYENKSDINRMSNFFIYSIRNRYEQFDDNISIDIDKFTNEYHQDDEKRFEIGYLIKLQNKLHRRFSSFLEDINKINSRAIQSFIFK